MASFNGLGRALRWIRQRQGKKQYEVAEAARITKAMLSSYENGRQRPTIDTLERILDALEIDLDYLAHAMRMVSQEAGRRGEGARSGASTSPALALATAGPFLDIERLLGLTRRLEPAEEHAVGQMLEGFHSLLQYLLTQTDDLRTRAETPQAGDAAGDAAD